MILVELVASEIDDIVVFREVVRIVLAASGARYAAAAAPGSR